MAGSLISLLGLGIRAGSVVAGTAGVRAAIRRGDVALVVVAEDHSRRTADKVIRLATASGVEVVVGPCASDLGRILNRDAVEVVGVRDPNLVAGIKAVAP